MYVRVLARTRTERPRCDVHARANVPQPDAVHRGHVGDLVCTHAGARTHSHTRTLRDTLTSTARHSSAHTARTVRESEALPADEPIVAARLRVGVAQRADQVAVALYAQRRLPGDTERGAAAPSMHKRLPQRVHVLMAAQRLHCGAAAARLLPRDAPRALARVGNAERLRIGRVPSQVKETKGKNERGKGRRGKKDVRKGGETEPGTATSKKNARREEGVRPPGRRPCRRWPRR